MLAIMLAIGLALDQGTPRTSAVDDSLLGDVYEDEKTVLCRDYLTANGARLATYQWWLMGFVSGARAAQGTKTPAVPRAGLNDVLGPILRYLTLVPDTPEQSASRYGRMVCPGSERNARNQ